MNRYPMTIEGEKALREELTQLKIVERSKISQALSEARKLGDLKENAEYHAARDRQSFAEGRINDIEQKLANAQVIDISMIAKTGKVVFGATVLMINLDDHTECEYKIVGDDEADIKANKISVNSPIARALVGKKEDDVVVVNTPSGSVEYKIDEVKHLA